MKVNVTIQIEVDAASWDEAYGTGTEPARVREDVKIYAVHAVQSSAGMQETGATVVAK